MLKIWGRNNSINVQKVLWCCEELSIPFSRVDAGGPFGGLDSPEFRQRNPNSLIPVVEDDGLVLWESNAIVRYLAERHGRGSLWPDDAHQRADADRWMDWQLSTLWPPFRVVFLGLVRTPPAKRDNAAIARSLDSTNQSMRILDDHLKDRQFIGGDHFNMGDIPLGCAAYRWLNMDIERPDLPHVRAWYERLTERPAYRTVVMLPIT